MLPSAIEKLFRRIPACYFNPSLFEQFEVGDLQGLGETCEQVFLSSEKDREPHVFAEFADTKTFSIFDRHI
jgi:hypothetical protein